MRTLGYTKVDGCAILVHGRAAPADDEWLEYLEAIHGWSSTEGLTRVLIYSVGGAPTPRQRALLDARLGVIKPGFRCAVMTGSTFVRGVLRAFSLLSPIYRGFDLEALEPALDHLGVPRSAHGRFRDQIGRFLGELNGSEEG